MTKKLSLDSLSDAVSEKVLHAARVASKMMNGAGVRHALIGGLAVGLHGYPRATKDVDFLVGDEGFDVLPGGVRVLKPVVPWDVRGIRVDALGDNVIPEGREVVQVLSKGIPVVDVETLIHLKLVAARRRDIHDVIELIKAGADERAVRRRLKMHGEPELIEIFNRLIADADAE